MLVGVFAMLPVLGFILFSGFEQRQIARENVKSDALRIARLAGTNQESLIEGARQLLTALAGLPEIQAYDKERCSMLLGGLLKRFQGYSNFGIASADGMIDVSAVPITEPVPVADRAWFQRTRKALDFSVGDYQVGRITKKPSLNFGYPLFDQDGKFQGVIYASMELSWVGRIPSEAHLPSGASVMIMDSNGMILARHPDPEKWVGKVIENLPILKGIEASHAEGSVEVDGSDGIRRLFAFKLLRGGGREGRAYVCVGIPSRMAFAEPTRQLWRNLAWMGSMTLLALCAAWFLGDVLVLKHVRALLQATRRLTAGDLQARTGLKHGHGELEELAGAFDEMAASLEKRLQEREQVGQELRAGQERERKIFTDSGVGMAMISLTGEFLRVNDAFCRFLGYRGQELLGKNMRQVLHPDEREPDGQSGNGQATQRYTKRYLHKSGRIIWGEVSVSLIRDTEGEPCYHAAQVLDITERKQAEEQLLESEKRYRGLVETTSDLVWAMDQNCVYTYCSPQIRDLLGYEPAEVLGRSPVEFMPPDEAERVGKILANIFKNKLPMTRFENTNLHKDGRQVILETNGTPILDRKGVLRGYRGIDRDVTARKQAEASLREKETQLRATLESTADGFLVVGQNGKITHFNKRFIEIWQVPHDLIETRDDNLLLRHVLDKLKDPARFLARVQELYQTTEDDTDTIEFKDGRFLERNSSPLVMDEKVCGRVWSFRDVTGRKLAEESLRLQREELERANRAKDEFIAMLSHELRTPLTPVLVCIDSLKTNPDLPEEIKSAVSMIRRNVQLEARLIDDLLDVARVKFGKKDLHPEIMETHSLLRDAVDICMPTIVAKDLSLALHLDAKHDVVEADPARLQQVFWNLISNAVKFTPKRGSITIRSSNPAPTLIVVEFTDNGEGIDPALQTRIFDPFEQGRRQFGSGLGLGLAIARGIVDAHGGRLTASSEGPGRGSTFRLELTTSGKPMEAEAPDPQSGEPQRSRAATTILLVEDHDDTRTIISKLLVRHGFTVHAADSFKAALATGDTGGFDLLICDLGLPDGSGLDLMKQLRGNMPGLRGISISGFGMEADIQRSREAGFAIHLVKPVTLAKLESAIDNTMAPG